MDIDLFTTTPQSVEFDRYLFLNEKKRISRLTEKYGFKEILIYSENRLADPWIMVRDRVGLFMEKTPKTIVAMLGITKAGGCMSRLIPTARPKE